MGKRGKEKTWPWRRWVGAVCILALFGALSGCGLRKNSYGEFLTVDVFDCLANYQGIQSGWFARLVEDQFNMELNIIAPNVAGGGDTLFETRAAAGNLGDLLIIGGERGDLQKLVRAGLLLDMEPYLKDKDIMRFEKAIRAANEGITPKGIYAIPSELSQNAPTVPGEVLEPVYGPYIRWDLYAELGYPRMETLEDLLPVLKQMQDLEPRAENGERTYGFSFFRDWDANLMNAAKQPCCFYGYDECGFTLVSADGEDCQNILDEDSLYIRTLKLYFEANQMGLVDPQSDTQNYDAVSQKYADGQILYCPWPWMAQNNYNTIARRQQGKGFMMADIEDMKIYSYGCSPEGNYKAVMSVGAGTRDPRRIVDFIDWLYSDDGISANGVGGMTCTAGPRGLTWDYGQDGPYLTREGEQALLEGSLTLPEEWGGGLFQDGICQLNYMPVGKNEVDEKGYPYLYQQWDSVPEMEETALERDWMQRMRAQTSMDYLSRSKKLAIAPGCAYEAPSDTTEEVAIRWQCRSVILKYSWDMVFAKNEEEFYRLYEKMCDEARSRGYDKIYEFDLKSAGEKEEARRVTMEKYGDADSAVLSQ